MRAAKHRCHAQKKTPQMFPSREHIDSAQGGTLQKLLSYNSELDSSLNLAVKLSNSLELTKSLN